MKKKLLPIENCFSCLYRRMSNSLVLKIFCTYAEERAVTEYSVGFPSWCPLNDEKKGKG